MTSLHLRSCFLRGSDSKDSACNTEDPDSIPQLGRSPEEEIATYSSTLALENPMDRGDCLLSGDSHSLWYHKRPDMTEQLALNYTYIHLCMEVRVQNEIFPE